MNWSKGKGTKGRASSFRRSVGYVSHDPNSKTSKRVGEVALLNLGGDLSTCAGEMETTYLAANAIQKRQRAAAGKRPGASGSKIEKPVYCFALSWHPDDKPTAAHMIDTAKDAIKRLGLSDHQAVIVEHKDRPHKHVHVVINLVHPETGKMANLYRDERTLDKFAHEYEASKMVIRSFIRAAKHQAKAEPVKPSFSKAARRPMAKEKAADIRKMYTEEKNRIIDAHKERDDRRELEKDAIWKRYESDRQGVYDKYQELMDELWKRAPRDPALHPRPPGMQRSRIKDLLYKDPNKGEPRPKITGRFAQALYAVRGSTETALVRSFREKHEGRDYSLPIMSTPSMRHYARAMTPNRRQRSEELKLARSNELADLTKGYEVSKIELGKVHDKERKDDKQDFDNLNKQSTDIWKRWQAEYDVPDAELPQWMKDLFEKDQKLIEQAELQQRPEQQEHEQEQAQPEIDHEPREAEQTLPEVEHEPSEYEMPDMGDTPPDYEMPDRER
jgi:Relaxase/Mobilisation nuclease domain